MTPARAVRNAQLGRDPTRSTVLRARYAAAHTRRWRWLRGAVREGVERNDALGIGQDPPSRPRILQVDPEVRELLNRLRRQIRQASQDGEWDRVRELARSFVSTPGRFNFPSDAFRLQAFAGWLTQAEEGGILEVVRNDAGEIVEEAGWQQTYVRRGYEKGVRQADQQLAAAGMEIPDEAAAQAISVPIHQRKLELLFTRNFTELQGITESTAQEVRRQLAEGLTRGENPRRVANRINDRVAAVGGHRSRVLARTEIIRAHSESTLTRFEQFGVDAVKGKAEFATAGDRRVCPICAGLEGQVFKIDEARGIIPVHPQCRCAWLPVIDESKLNRRNEAGASRFLQLLRERRADLWPGWLHPPELGRAA